MNTTRWRAPALALTSTTLMVALVAACAPEFTQWSGETTVGVPAASSAPPPVASAPPPVKPSRVTVSDARVEIAEKIQFESNKAAIKPESSGLLDEIAAAIKTHPNLKKIRVEGHASSDGDAKANLKLSDDRAKAVVDDLVKRGVPAGVLTGKGFGSTQPIASNDTEDGREKNRRVDFVIVDPAPPASAKPAPSSSASAPKAGHP